MKGALIHFWGRSSISQFWQVRWSAGIINVLAQVGFMFPIID